MEKQFCCYCGKPIDECNEDCVRDERFPVGYAEIDYDNFDNAEAVGGAGFDDLNYLRYFER